MKTVRNVLCAIALVSVSAMSLAAAANAPTRIAVLDREAAILATNAAQAAQEKLATDMKPQRDKLEQLRKDIKAMEEKFVKEAAAMSERDKKALREQADQKANEFNSLVTLVQKRTQDAQQDLLNKLLPSMQSVLDEMRKSGNFDVILDRRGVIYVDPDLDLTKRVVDRLNAAK
ncbi:OmpH family outer membrane protein [Perlucidibaca aquatica]|uniref:OmpH family outer membrane protein n=1 Tax=Perlucidibaca aquatica TaxID=1852776 RepID=UPI00083B901F|nr:OmpH family outer membrane protein [Perlucidibaca aquatica]